MNIFYVKKKYEKIYFFFMTKFYSKNMLKLQIFTFPLIADAYPLKRKKKCDSTTT